jgi:hypothetical protein
MSRSSIKDKISINREIIYAILLTLFLVISFLCIGYYSYNGFASIYSAKNAAIACVFIMVCFFAIFRQVYFAILELVKLHNMINK